MFQHELIGHQEDAKSENIHGDVFDALDEYERDLRESMEAFGKQLQDQPNGDDDPLSTDNEYGQMDSDVLMRELIKETEETGRITFGYTASDGMEGSTVDPDEVRGFMEETESEIAGSTTPSPTGSPAYLSFLGDGPMLETIAEDDGEAEHVVTEAIGSRETSTDLENLQSIISQLQSQCDGNTNPSSIVSCSVDSDGPLSSIRDGVLSIMSKNMDSPGPVQESERDSDELVVENIQLSSSKESSLSADGLVEEHIELEEEPKQVSSVENSTSGAGILSDISEIAIASRKEVYSRDDIGLPDTMSDIATSVVESGDVSEGIDLSDDLNAGDDFVESGNGARNVIQKAGVKVPDDLAFEVVHSSDGSHGLEHTSDILSLSGLSRNTAATDRQPSNISNDIVQSIIQSNASSFGDNSTHISEGIDLSSGGSNVNTGDIFLESGVNEVAESLAVSDFESGRNGVTESLAVSNFESGVKTDLDENFGESATNVSEGIDLLDDSNPKVELDEGFSDFGGADNDVGESIAISEIESRSKTDLEDNTWESTANVSEGIDLSDNDSNIKVDVDDVFSDFGVAENDVTGSIAVSDITSAVKMDLDDDSVGTVANISEGIDLSDDGFNLQVEVTDDFADSGVYANDVSDSIVVSEMGSTIKTDFDDNVGESTTNVSEGIDLSDNNSNIKVDVDDAFSDSGEAENDVIDSIAVSDITSAVKTDLDDDFDGTADVSEGIDLSDDGSNVKVEVNEAFSDSGGADNDVEDSVTVSEIVSNIKTDFDDTVTNFSEGIDVSDASVYSGAKHVSGPGAVDSATLTEVDADSLTDDFVDSHADMSDAGSVAEMKTDDFTGASEFGQAVETGASIYEDDFTGEGTFLTSHLAAKPKPQRQVTETRLESDDLDETIPMIPRALVMLSQSDDKESGQYSEEGHDSGNGKRRQKGKRGQKGRCKEKVPKKRDLQTPRRPKEQMSDAPPARTHIQLELSRVFDVATRDDEELVMEDMSISMIETVADRKPDTTDIEIPTAKLSMSRVVIQKDIRPKKTKKKRQRSGTEIRHSTRHSDRHDHTTQAPQVSRFRTAASSLSRTVITSSGMVPTAAEMIDQNYVNTLHSAKQRLDYIRESIHASRRIRALRESGVSRFTYTDNPFSSSYSSD